MELKVGSIYRRKNGNTCIITMVNDTEFCGRLFYDKQGHTYNENGEVVHHSLYGNLVEEISYW